MKFTLTVSLLVVLGFSMCRKPAVYFYNEGFIYGTIYHIVYESPKGNDLHERVKAKLNEYNRIFSTFDSTSTISRVNNNRPVKPEELFITCFERSMEDRKSVV